MLVPSSESSASPAGMRGRTKLWRGFWMLAASLAAVCIIFSLVMPRRTSGLTDSRRAQSYLPPSDVAQVTGARQILIKSGTPLAHSLGIMTVAKETVSYPLLTVTGSVVARIRPGGEPLEERWQFASVDVASAYADWVKIKADIEFNQKQLVATRELAHAQADRYQAIVERMRPLGATESIAKKDLLTAEADLVQAKLQGQKDVFAAESALRAALRQKSALERQLAQAGIEPIVLSRARDGMVLISANVPEAKISSVKEGQACEARFYGFPGVVFSADVEELGSVLSTQRRTMRVLFDLSDTQDQLKPGMFAEVGLGTSAREALLIPANAVLHIGRSDYVFKEASDGQHLDVTEVQVSESPNDNVEVLKGLKPGDRIAGTEAVLLKPLAVQSLAK